MGIAIKNTKKFKREMCEALQASMIESARAEMYASCPMHTEESWSLLVRCGVLCMIDGTHTGTRAINHGVNRTWK